MPSGALVPVYRWTAMYQGAVAPGAKLYTWLSGTNTPQPVYTTSALNVAHANPVEAGADGTFPVMYMSAVAYRMEIRTSTGVVIFPAQDNIYDFGQIQFSSSGGSALIGYIQSGTGAVAQTVQGRLRNYVLLTDFGGVGDGTTDNSAALSAAVVRTQTLGGTIYIPPGTYVFNSNVTVPVNVSLAFAAGAILSPTTGVTITVAGPVEAGLWKIIAGAGTVNLTSALVEAVYPEWWGVDGTADDVQINLALATGQRVTLRNTTYNIAAPLLPVTGSSLNGQGKGVTTLHWSGSTQGNQTGQIQILNKSNVRLSGFTLDCHSVVATVLTGSGIVIDDGPVNIVIEDVHVYDCYRHALLINNGNGIHVSRLKVSVGCTSSAILIGQFPASYGLSVDKDCQNVFCNDITIDQVQSDAFGVWNCSGGDGYTTRVCKHINTNGLIVTSWGIGGSLSYAYWGSGVVTTTTDVNLTNFCLDNTAVVGANVGRGLHTENGFQWNHSNGTIRNLLTTAADEGYAITAGGGSYMTYSNIDIYACGIGVLANNSSFTKFTNITVNYATYAAFYVGGSNLQFTNCSGFTTGAVTATDQTWLIFAASPLTVENVTLDGCYGYTSTPNGTPYGVLVTATAMSSLRVTNFRTDGTLGLNPGTKHLNIHGDTFAVALPGAAAGTDYELPITVPAPQGGRRLCILNAYLSFSTGIPVDVGNYNTYKLIRRDAGGINPMELTSAGILTSTTDMSVAFKSATFALTSAANANIGSGNILTLAKTHTGTGKAETNGVLVIEYTSY